MSDFRKQYWRDRLGIGLGDKFTAFDGKEYLVTDISVNNRGSTITDRIVLDFESDYRHEHGTLYNIFDMIDWNKTTLFNERGQISLRTDLHPEAS